MGGSFTIGIKWDEAGLARLQSKLESLSDLSGVNSVVAANGSRLQKLAMANAPVRHGDLKRSIELLIEDDGLTSVVKPGMEYAAYVEYGTRFMAAQPYLRPAFDQVKPEFISDLERVVWKK